MTDKETGIKVVIAEDEPPIGRFLCRLVEQTAGFSVAAVCLSGETAVQAVKEWNAELIITDIRMSGMSGLELIGRIKEETGEISSIIVTGHKTFEYAKEAITLGIDAFITKPIDQQELRTALEAIRRSHSSLCADNLRQKLQACVRTRDDAAFRKAMPYGRIRSLIVYYSGGSMDIAGVMAGVKQGLIYVQYKESVVAFENADEEESCFDTVVTKVLCLKNRKRTCVCVRVESGENDGSYVARLRSFYRNTVRRLAVPGRSGSYRYAGLEDSVLAPAEPDADRAAHNGGMTAYGGDLAAHGRGMTAYGGDLAAHGRGMTAYGGDLAAHGRGMTAYGGDLAAHGRGMTAHAGGRTAADGNMLAEYPWDEELYNRLELEILAKDRVRIWTGLHGLFDNWKEHEASVFHMRRQIHAVSAVMERAGLLSGDKVSVNDQIDESLMALDSYEEIRDAALRCWKRGMQEGAGTAGNRDLRMFEQIRVFIEQNRGQNYSLQEICSIFKASPPYIRKVFKQYTGRSYNEYVMERKIEFAVKLMDANPGIFVKDIADMLGYEQLYFGTVFKKVTGVSPSRYRSRAAERGNVGGQDG